MNSLAPIISCTKHNRISTWANVKAIHSLAKRDKSDFILLKVVPKGNMTIASTSNQKTVIWLNEFHTVHLKDLFLRCIHYLLMGNKSELTKAR